MLSIAVTEAAGWKDRSLERLAELLRLAREADYIRPLERFGDLCRVVLGRLLETGPGRGHAGCGRVDAGAT